MSEFWVSQKKYWCVLCRVWLADNQQSRRSHEAGSAHQAALNKRLRDARKKEERENKEEETGRAVANAAETEAIKAYEEDKRRLGRPEDGLGIQKLRDAVRQPQPPTPTSTAAPTAAGAAPTTLHALGYGSLHPRFVLAQQQRRKPDGGGGNTTADTAAKERLMYASGGVALGGRIGAARGSTGPSSSAAGGTAISGGIGGGGDAAAQKKKKKRARTGEGDDQHQKCGKPGKTGKRHAVDPEEARALAIREAARARVAARSKASFGLQ